jgi:hypothetical protein
MSSRKLLIAGILFASAAASNANAAPIIFDLTSPDSRNGVYNSTYAMQYNYEENDLALSLTGWSYGVKTTTSSECTKWKRGVCTKSKTVTTTSLDEAIEQDYVGKWDGLGTEKTDSPNHAVDNEDGDYDMHLLSFDELVKLTTLNIGWFEDDTDISILAFDGGAFDSSSLLGKKWQDLIGDGWSLVGNYYNVDMGGNSGAVNLDGVVSQYWLVGAYNTSFGNVFSGPNKNKTSGDDYYKLKGVTAERPPVPERTPVPEPASALLFGAAMLGLQLARRRAAR